MRRILLAAILVAACTNDVQKLDPNEVCKDIEYSIASRTFACTGNGDLANKRGHAFADGYMGRCQPLEQLEVAYRCPVSIEALPCSTVTANGDDLDQWLKSGAPECAQMFGLVAP